MFVRQVHVHNWMAWERQLNSRQLTWEDGHTSSTHIDMSQSTWVLTRDDQGRKCELIQSLPPHLPHLAPPPLTHTSTVI